MVYSYSQNMPPDIAYSVDTFTTSGAADKAKNAAAGISRSLHNNGYYSQSF